METNIVRFILIPVLQKSGEIVLELLLKKFWKWAISDGNLKRFTTAVKLQILVLYLDWLLQKSEPDEWVE